MPRPLMLVLAWMLTFGLAFAGPGKYFDATIEGLDMAHAPLLPTVLALLSLLAAIYITVRRPGGFSTPAPSGRRQFLTVSLISLGGLAAAGLAILFRVRGWLTVTFPAVLLDVTHTDPNPEDSWQRTRIEQYRRLGRTGFEVSDISLGSARIREDNDGKAIARAAIERGDRFDRLSTDNSIIRARRTVV